MRRNRRTPFVALAVLATAAPATLVGQGAADSVRRARECSHCAEWNVAHSPVPIYGNTYYVGTTGLSAILITSPTGDVLIDGDLPESAPHILANIRALGAEPKDVKLILNTHAHYDHAGGIEALRAATGAKVAASPWSVRAMRAGHAIEGDPQLGIALPFPAVHAVRTIEDGETLHVGDIAITAHFTPGHTPGGTTWTWKSCDGDRCLNFVYSDSESPVSADDFRFSAHPTVVEQFERSFRVLEQLPCDVLLTPHPEQSNFWSRALASTHNGPDAFVDRGACRRYVDEARKQLADRLEKERKAR